MVQWSYLEHGLLSATTKAASSVGQTVPNDACNPSFTKRLRSWRQLIQQMPPESDLRERFLQLADRIANAEDHRHKICHGLWDWDVTDPSRLIASSKRQPYFYEMSFDCNKLVGFAQNIGELAYELMFDLRDPKEVIIEHFQGASFSRSFLQKIVKKDH